VGMEAAEGVGMEADGAPTELRDSRGRWCTQTVTNRGGGGGGGEEEGEEEAEAEGAEGEEEGEKEGRVRKEGGRGRFPSRLQFPRPRSPHAGRVRPNRPRGLLRHPPSFPLRTQLVTRSEDPARCKRISSRPPLSPAFSPSTGPWRGQHQKRARPQSPNCLRWHQAPGTYMVQCCIAQDSTGLYSTVYHLAAF